MATLGTYLNGYISWQRRAVGNEANRVASLCMPGCSEASLGMEDLAGLLISQLLCVSVRERVCARGNSISLWTFCENQMGFPDWD